MAEVTRIIRNPVRFGLYPFSPEEIAIRQVAALPYRLRPDGEPEVLLITSRETRRWLIPKGNPIPGLCAHEAAAQEAWEEAGVRGQASAAPLGQYRYGKRRRDGRVRRADVAVFPLRVMEQAPAWPEQADREVAWFALPAAAAAVDDEGLALLIARFRAPAG